VDCRSIQIGKGTQKTNDVRATKNKQIVSHVTPHTPKKGEKYTSVDGSASGGQHHTSTAVSGEGFPPFWVDWAGRHRPPMERAFIRAGKTIKNVAREKQSIFFQRVGLLLPLGEMYLKGVKNLGLFA